MDLIQEQESKQKKTGEFYLKKIFLWNMEQQHKPPVIIRMSFETQEIFITLISLHVAASEFVFVLQVDAGRAAHADWQEGVADQWDLPAERRHRPAANHRDAAALHQSLPAGHHLTGNAHTCLISWSVNCDIINCQRKHQIRSACFTTFSSNPNTFAFWK